MNRTQSVLDRLITDTRLNAVLGWLWITGAVIALVRSILTSNYLWALFTGAALLLLVVPPIVNRDWTVMVPWELLGACAVPILLRSLALSGTVNTYTTYISLAAVSLLIAVELHLFTEIRFTHFFAVVFVVVSTLALAGTWAIVRYLFDTVLGTTFLTTNELLMQEFLTVTVTGIGAGLVFDQYFIQRDQQLRTELPGVSE